MHCHVLWNATLNTEGPLSKLFNKFSTIFVPRAALRRIYWFSVSENWILGPIFDLISPGASKLERLKQRFVDTDIVLYQGLVVGATCPNDPLDDR